MEREGREEREYVVDSYDGNISYVIEWYDKRPALRRQAQ